MGELRDFGMISVSDYTRKSLEEATQYAKDGGYTDVRVVETDGRGEMFEMDVKSHRINFRVVGGYVTDAFGG